MLGYRSPNFIYSPPNCSNLRMLMKSRDVSSNISAQARRILTKKGQI